jgi:hypothetical protein
MLCRSYEADEQLLGSHLVHRHLSADSTMPQAPIWLVRSLAHSGDAKVRRAGTAPSGAENEQ